MILLTATISSVAMITSHQGWMTVEEIVEEDGFFRKIWDLTNIRCFVEYLKSFKTGGLHGGYSGNTIRCVMFPNLSV
jgi:hypothetical protein